MTAEHAMPEPEAVPVAPTAEPEGYDSVRARTLLTTFLGSDYARKVHAMTDDQVDDYIDNWLSSYVNNTPEAGREAAQERVANVQSSLRRAGGLMISMSEDVQLVTAGVQAHVDALRQEARSRSPGFRAKPDRVEKATDTDEQPTDVIEAPNDTIEVHVHTPLQAAIVNFGDAYKLSKYQQGLLVRRFRYADDGPINLTDEVNETLRQLGLVAERAISDDKQALDILQRRALALLIGLDMKTMASAKTLVFKKTFQQTSDELARHLEVAGQDLEVVMTELLDSLAKRAHQ